ncbi:orexigenic neuropeptide QRFP [Rhinatrema bivittatum]|uniref:orexigenic neuropeptide QRFP n=1 Tax=Rhinatrema bivittatum TaxID=194408 RepID=UPI00112A7A92|nr:orexigenic neuropeptide QRFP [Rhinatrema bivittatum]
MNWNLSALMPLCGSSIKMNGTRGLSFLLLLGLGTCFAPDESKEQGEPEQGWMFWRHFPQGSENYLSSLFSGAPRQKKSEDLSSLFSVAKELQGFGKEKAGFRFRFGREEEENGATDFLSLDEQKRGGSPLGSLAEELNGYNRKKGGFSFRFGRR